MKNNFREIEHNLSIVLNTPYLQIMAADITPEANGLLCYGYIDKKAGLTYEVLAYVYYVDGDYTIVKEDQTLSMKVRGESFKDATIIPIKNKALMKRFEVIIRIIKENYYSNDEMEETRNHTSLDLFRHEYYPDDVQAILFVEHLKPESVWVRVKKYVGRYENMELFLGELLNTPFDSGYGSKAGDIVSVATISDDEEKFCFIANKT